MQMAENMQDRDLKELYQNHFGKAEKDALSDHAFCLKGTGENGSLSKSMLSMRGNLLLPKEEQLCTVPGLNIDCTEDC